MEIERCGTFRGQESPHATYVAPGPPLFIFFPPRFLSSFVFSIKTVFAHMRVFIEHLLLFY